MLTVPFTVKVTAETKTRESSFTAAQLSFQFGEVWTGLFQEFLGNFSALKEVKSVIKKH